MTGARRILIVRLGAIGDVVRTLPVLAPLRRIFPDASISWIAEEGPASLLSGHALLDEVIVLPRQILSREITEPSTFFPALFDVCDIASGLRSRRFDIALDFHGTLKSGVVSKASGAPVRWGYDPPGSKEGNRFFNNRHVALLNPRVNRIERNLVLVRALAESEQSTVGPIPTAGPEAVGLPITPANRLEVDQWLSTLGIPDDCRRIVVYPGTSARQAYKRYPTADLARVTGQLTRTRSIAVIVAGGPGEEDLVHEVQSGGSPERTFRAPALSLLELAELIRRSDLFIGPDTGPMHMAWAVGTRVLALFGATDPVLNAPWGEDHAVLYNGAPGRHHPEWSPPDEVVRVARCMIGSDRGRSGNS